MIRDYSAFLPDATPARRAPSALERLGWGPALASQIDVEAFTETPPVRVVAVHRSGLQVAGDGIDETIPPGPEATVGDWLLLDRARPRSSRVLDRKSLIKRRAPGTGREVQLIAANIDTIFVVTSCNADFNVARLERYVALAFEAGIEPMIVLTKADIAEDTVPYIDAAQAVSERVPVVALDARGAEPVEALADWCKPGRTVAFLGSSGVGKSTMTNALLSTQAIATQDIRDDDAKGRHTTTRRELHATPSGCLVLDTPGMRELQLTDAAAGIADVFEDIEALAANCRFTDCQHKTEPGCAILAAIEGASLDPARLARWRKLQAEDAFNSASLAERREKDRAFGKLVRSAMKAKSDRER
ncbi:ribosome small subunit-dependent GTPase A [Sulfitobacter sp. KE29]|uniref:ribosome small subunit-dependent GTPase A n=1 Tax=Sulfitobacter TaxID=60136 RepID=UPI0007C3FD2E|nr:MULTISPECIES: ribosome small subunit-dependent GTPase A [Sulfitobacter]KZY54118.1 GTP-binding protein EngC [Sulfitobacter sp. HI0054]MBO9440246.1 ribosome small subunit-dependent GTPase A [Sulfitobacter sp. R18_2]MDF3420061.1 ribosome small subunit-dependent GTPase A [Sulfitobacter sp. Ks38]MDF3427578.1 ribosome small subunit-dependent GTPase A [Sulfitobacter sp. KE29]MDF3431158.1 ribosome small subunit-dependent GTPase A [Sulfitobacter sp. S46]